MTAPPETTESVDDDDLGALYGQVVAAFEEVALLTTSEKVPLNDVLRLVGRRLCELLGVSRCSVYLRREDGLFQGQVGYCAGRGNIDAGISRLVAGGRRDRFTAEIVATAAPVLVHGAATDPRTVQRTMRRWGVRDMLGVPLVVDREVIGIIYVDNQAEDHLYTTRDVRLAQTFAGMAAIAVRQAWLYQQLAKRATVIDHQRRVLGASTAIHNRVTQAVLDGAAIPEILRLIVELLGKPVVLYDATMTPVEWAAPENLSLTRAPGLAREQVALPAVRQALARLDEGNASVMLPASPQLRWRRLLARMVAEQRCVGYLELCELGCAFSQTDAKALEQVAMTVALKLLTTARHRDARRHEREELLADLLYGRRPAERLAARAASYGLDVQGRHAVLRLQYEREAEGDATGEPRREAVAAALGRLLRGPHRCAGHLEAQGADLFLLAAPAEAEEAGLRAELSAAVDELAREQRVRLAVVSAWCRSLAELPAATERVHDVAGLFASAPPEQRLVFARDLELVRLVSQRDGLAGVRRYGRELLAPLLAHDSATGGVLVETLRVYIACDAHIHQAALALGVHENTVRYRLNRIRELSTIDPGQLDQLLLASLALQVLSLPAGVDGVRG